MIVMLGFLGSVSGLKLVELQAATAMVVSEVKEIARSLGRELQGETWEFFRLSREKKPCDLAWWVSPDKLWVYEKKSGAVFCVA